VFKLENSLSYPQGTLATPVRVFPKVEAAIPGQNALEDIQCPERPRSANARWMEISQRCSVSGKSWGGGGEGSDVGLGKNEEVVETEKTVISRSIS